MIASAFNGVFIEKHVGSDAFARNFPLLLLPFVSLPLSPLITVLQTHWCESLSSAKLGPQFALQHNVTYCDIVPVI